MAVPPGRRVDPATVAAPRGPRDGAAPRARRRSRRPAHPVAGRDRAGGQRARATTWRTCRVSRAGRRHVVRVIVDADGGINLDAVADVSRAVSAALDAAEEAGGDILAGEYQLEVSSPGVDRPLTLPRHWRRNVGRLVKVTVRGGSAARSARRAARRGPPGDRPGGRGRRRGRGAGDRRRPRRAGRTPSWARAGCRSSSTASPSWASRTSSTTTDETDELDDADDIDDEDDVEDEER